MHVLIFLACLHFLVLGLVLLRHNNPFSLALLDAAYEPGIIRLEEAPPHIFVSLAHTPGPRRSGETLHLRHHPSNHLHTRRLRAPSPASSSYVTVLHCLTAACNSRSLKAWRSSPTASDLAGSVSVATASRPCPILSSSRSSR